MGRQISLCLLATTLLLAALAAPPALATAGGANGVIAYRSVLDPNTPTARSAIFLTGSGALTQPRSGSPPDFDFSPAWSPDGEKIAFLRIDQLLFDYLIEIVDRDGTNLRQLISSDAFDQVPPPGHENAQLSSPAWSSDGERIVFVVRHPGRPFDDGLWTIGVDGTGLSMLVPDEFADQPEWAPLGTEIAYMCRFRGGAILRQDLCVVDAANGAFSQLSIDVPGAFNVAAGRPRWTPDGEKLVFSVSYVSVENNHPVSRSEIFTMNPDGTGLRELTHAPDACPGQLGNTSALAQASVSYRNPTPSPDGELIVAQAFRAVVTGSHPQTQECTYNFTDSGLWTLPIQGGTGSLLVSDNFAFQPDWQPIPADLTVFVDDGHNHPLSGLKVELRTQAGVVVDDRPIHTAGGSYAFQNVAPGEYRIRATLTDHNYSGNPLAIPSFDIRHNAEPDEAVWMERNFTLLPGAVLTPVPLHFAESPQLEATSVAPPDEHRLDDMAAIYFRMRQFVDWVKHTLTPETGPTVSFRTFASDINGHPFRPDGAFYTVNGEIFLGPVLSEYEMRDGVFDVLVGDQAPENAEWHEFVHHLFRHFVTDNQPCGGTNHGGYDNEDTCDSLNEGFAAFLPAFAAQAIEGATDSFYDGLIDLEPNLKAWNYRDSSDGQTRSGEDIAVSGVFWDLVDGNADSESTFIVRPDGLHFPTAFTDATSMTIEQVWDQLTTARPRTVLAFRRSFGQPALTLDPDLDGTPDLATVDQVFLLHGFFPIDREQHTHLNEPETYHYEVNYAQRANPTADRNAAVGDSGHKIYEDGIVQNSFVPRANTPLAKNANVEMHVEDLAGTPLSGAEVSLSIAYPGLQRTITRRLGRGDGSLLHLELPPHFDYLLPPNAAVPACNPASDVHVQVTLTTRLNGFVSEDTHTFDNCTYLLASENATGPAALAFTASFPVDATPPVSTVDARASVPPIGNNTLGFWKVELACDDPVDGGFASGCARSEYSLDGGPFTLYAGSVVIDEVGQHDFAFRSVDGAANTETSRSIQLGVVDEPDSDGDGLGDFTEAALGTNPSDPDTDDDGLDDGDEVTRGTNPLDADSDDDGLSDGNEVTRGTNPRDADSDDDGLSDGAEVAAGSDPLAVDTDGDGLNDGPDNCKIVANPGQEDYEGDALGDVCDPDDDNDGSLDTQDPFPRSDLRATCIIGTCDSGVPNRVASGGATMNDQLAQCQQTSTTQRGFERCVQQLAGGWQRQKLITAAQKKRIQSCASQFTLGGIQPSNVEVADPTRRFYRLRSGLGD